VIFKALKINMKDNKHSFAKKNIDVECREVGLRDGLQILKTIFPTDQKIAWIEEEAAAGMPEIEVGSFVPPKLLPQFADAGDVVPAALSGTSDSIISSLMPNLKGAQRGFELGVHKLNYVTSVSVSHNKANVNRSPDESVENFKEIVAERDALPEARQPTLAVGLSTAFGCTIEGRVDPAEAIALGQKFVDAGVDELVVADTVGYANPTEVKALMQEFMSEFSDTLPVACHFHDTRGLGMANVFAALEAGVRRFDASLAGLGGCPYAPSATGNIVMEDLVFLLEGAGLRTGIDLDKLVGIREIVADNLPDETLYGMYARAGAPKGFKPATEAA